MKEATAYTRHAVKKRQMLQQPKVIAIVRIRAGDVYTVNLIDKYCDNMCRVSQSPGFKIVLRKVMVTQTK